MDLALAIAKIDPKAQYRLNHSQADDRQVVLEWRGAGPLPSQAMLDEAWRLCLEEQAVEDAIEQERQLAIERIKGNIDLSDVALVLRL